MPLYHDSDAHSDRDDLRAFYTREAKSRRKVRDLDCQFCIWMAGIFVLAVLISIFR